DAVAVGENEPLHLGVPTTGLMPEVGAAVQQLFHGYNSHSRPCPLVVGCRPASGDAGPWCLLAAGPVRRRDRRHPGTTLTNRVVAQTREVSPLERAAVSSLHAGQGCFSHP